MFNSCELPSDWNTSKRPLTAHPSSITQQNTKHSRQADCSSSTKSKKQAILYHATHPKYSSGNKSHKMGQLDLNLVNEKASSSAINEENESYNEGAQSSMADNIVQSASLGPRFHISTLFTGDAIVEQDDLFSSSFSSRKSDTKNTASDTALAQIRNLILDKLDIQMHTHSAHPFQDEMFEDSAVLETETQCWSEEQKKKMHASIIDTDCLISRLPYKKMLTDMFGGGGRGHLQVHEIPYVTRAYEEAFMHEPVNSQERECSRGSNCECMFIDKSQPFVCVEFLLPGEQPSRSPNLCVLCNRAVTQQLYYDVIFDKHEFPGTIQRFGNIHSEPGEYSLDAMLIASPSAPVHIMPLPMVSHQRNRYSVYVVAGIKRLKQHRVYFQLTPSCAREIGQ